VLNDERRILLEQTIPQGATLAFLKQLTESASVPSDVRSKADQAIRQLTAEFSLRR
jgi:uncharacterized protein (UPF0147 family)